jgi:hypothetical protein
MWNKFEEAEASESANREMSMLAVHKTARFQVPEPKNHD